MGKKKILIAEDEENIISLIRIIFGETYDLVVVRDGIEVYNVVKKEKPDLILLDIMLPRVSGFDICKRLKSDSQTKKTIIIILSAKGMKSDIEKGLKSGADYYLTKPFEPEELESIVKHMLDGEDN